MKETDNIPETKAIKPKIRLDEVTLMRTILAILIVFMHSFTCYNGSWEQPAGYVDMPLYKWLARTSFAFTLESFVFLSGYLYAFQRITLQRTDGFWKLTINKLKRLILPSIIFSVLYFVLFFEYKGVGDAVYSIINGCGHMWYLPMLFWCFVGGWFLEQVKIKDGWKMAFLVALNLLNVISLPLRISTAVTYLVYFYGGCLVYKHSDKIKNYITPRNLVFSWVIFIILFAVFRPLPDILSVDSTCSNAHKALMLVLCHVGQLIYASVGSAAFYMTAVYFTQHHQLYKNKKKISASCFGIYLFQQFVLQLLYYKTEFSMLVGPCWLPWCGFLITILVSFVVSSLFLKTKTGRFLIG